MTDASISTLGIGSGLELQSILDQLRDVDEQATLTPKQNKITELEQKLDEFTVVNNKLLVMKSAALSLSLTSTYLERTVTSSDESVFTASVVSGTTVQATSVTVDRLATKSSWLSGGASSNSAIVYVPTSQESTAGVTDPAAANLIAANDTLVITFGDTSGTPQVITVNVTAGMSMNDVVSAINNDDDNGNGAPVSEFVTAETYVVGSDTFMRVRSTAGGNGESDRVTITTQLTDIALAPPDDVFQYEVGPAGSTTVVTLNVAADTTLSGLVDLINDDTDNPGVTASAIDDGSASNPYKLLLKADDTGEDGRINITGQLADITFTEQQGAAAASLNAQITLDSISYERQTNTISDVVTGVTLSLESAGTSTLTVSNNNDNIAGYIKSMVTAYNDVVQEIKSKTEYDKDTEKFGILASTTLRDLPFELQDLLTTTVRADTDGNVTTIFDFGFEFESDGTVSIDETVLNTTLSTYGTDVQEFFLGDDTRDIVGLGDKINDRLRTITSGTGQIGFEKSSASIMIDDLELDIESATERLDKRYAILTKRFIELDQYMSRMTSMSNYLTTQFDSLNNLFSSKK